MMTLALPSAHTLPARPRARRSELPEAIVLAGGYGKGLLPLTQHRPPSLLPLASRALIEHTLDGLKRAGVKHVVLAVHHRAQEMIRHFLYRPCGVDLSFVTEELPLDTAGAIRQCLPSIRGERCFAVYGDVFTEMNLREMLAAHLREGAEITMALAATTDPSCTGLVSADPAGRVLSMQVKPAGPQREVSAGVFIFECAALDRLPARPASLERDVLQALLEQGVPIYGHRADGYWTRLGTPADYLRLHHDLLSGKITMPPGVSQASPGIWLGRDVELVGDALLRAPVLIGDGARIEGGAVVGPVTVLGHHVTIGHNASVRGSLIWNETVVDAGSCLVQCVIGERNRLSGKLQSAIRGDHAVMSAAQPVMSSWKNACPVGACVPGVAHLAPSRPASFREGCC
ncbi:MAG: sugar phosphate nucleotidyltransferase [Armatimonadota bacterium]